MSNQEKKTVWIYAVVLFTSAFVVLLITAYSQIKFNNNIEDYKNELSEHQKEKKFFKNDLQLALNEINKLNDQIAQLKKENAEKNKVITDKTSEIQMQTEKIRNHLYQYEMLLQANEAYSKGNDTQCALLLKKNIQPEYLDDYGLKLYDMLVDKTNYQAALNLFREGRSLYQSKKYYEAIDTFSLSLQLTQEDFFSDDCYYYMAYAYYRAGDVEKCLQNLQFILQKYPSSSYIQDVLDLEKKVKR